MLNPTESSSNVTTLPRGGRDGFIADTAVRLDRLEVAASRLQQDSEHARAALLVLLEGDRAQFAALPHNTFEAVNKRLQELSKLETEIEKAENSVRRTSYMFYAITLVLASTVVAYFLPSFGLT